MAILLPVMTPTSLENRPPIEELQSVYVIEDGGKPFVEVWMETHKSGDACETLTIEYFPEGVKEDSVAEKEGYSTSDPCTRLLQRKTVTDEEQRKYKTFASVVGRLTYHGP